MRVTFSYERQKHLLTEKVSWTYDELMFDSLSQHQRFHFKKVSPHQVVRLPGGFVVGRLAVDDLLVGLLRTIWKSRVMEELRDSLDIWLHDSSSEDTNLTYLSIEAT